VLLGGRPWRPARKKKAYCLRLLTRAPKKPNSAKRKVAHVSVYNSKYKQKIIYAYLPGVGHSLQKFSQVLVRGGRRQDLPGMKYILIRGAYDFKGLYKRRQARSKYGTKKRYS